MYIASSCGVIRLQMTRFILVLYRFFHTELLTHGYEIHTMNKFNVFNERRKKTTNRNPSTQFWRFIAL